MKRAPLDRRRPKFMSGRLTFTSGRPKFTIRRHKSNKDSLLSVEGVRWRTHFLFFLGLNLFKRGVYIDEIDYTI